MNEYTVRTFDLVNNESYQFYEVSVNGRYMFREFVETLGGNGMDLKKLKAIYRYMDIISPRVLLPKTKFRHIEDKDNPLYWEFKKGDIRVYVVRKEPSMFVVLGGHKGRQKADIKRMKSLFKDFKGDLPL